MNNIFFTADTHFMHENILSANPDLINKGRPWSNTRDHDEELLANWNNVVDKNDVVYHLGDFALGKGPKKVLQCYYQAIIYRLNGKKHLIIGNHDKKETLALDGWESINNMMKIKVFDQVIILCHYPMMAWDRSHYGTWHLHGHMHNMLNPSTNRYRIDVGVDNWSWAPVSFNRIKQECETIEFKKITDLQGE